MAKINNVGLNLGQKIANPFKTSRSSTTNPFKYQNFEGKTLEVELFADVFEQKHNNKMKMISSAVAGSMSKIRSSIPESIVNFVNRVREGVSNAWTYAKNTNMSDVKGFRTISRALNTDIVDIGKGISSSISGLGHSISETLNKDVDLSGITGIGKGISDKWGALISKINTPHHAKISKDLPVADLKAMWIDINNLEAERMVA